VDATAKFPTSLAFATLDVESTAGCELTVFCVSLFEGFSPVVGLDVRLD